MIIEYFCIGFLAGAVFAAIFFMMGVVYDHYDKREFTDNNGVRIYIPIRFRNRCSNRRFNTKKG